MLIEKINDSCLEFLVKENPLLIMKPAYRKRHHYQQRGNYLLSI